ncbi:MAG: phage tail tube protein [Gallionella sp.]|jgi:hypothetical protein
MAIQTKGTDLFAVDPADGSLIEVACVTSIDGIDTAIDQIETTCLANTARTYVAGLASPGAATFGINTDTSEASHLRLHQLKVAGTVLHWALGWGDGTANPTVDSNDTFNLPTTRSWITFDGYMNAYPFSFALNAVVTSSIGVQISGDPVLVPKV